MFRSTLVAIAIMIAIILVEAPTSALTCSLSTQPPLVFPAYNVFNAAITTQTGSVTVACQPFANGSGATLNLILSAGNSGNTQNRTMAGGLPYNIYFTSATDASTTFPANKIIDLTTGLTFAIPNGNHSVGYTNTISFEGQIPAKQNVPWGSYSDSLSFTLNSQ